MIKSKKCSIVQTQLSKEKLKKMVRNSEIQKYYSPKIKDCVSAYNAIIANKTPIQPIDFYKMSLSKCFNMLTSKTSNAPDILSEIINQLPHNLENLIPELETANLKDMSNPIYQIKCYTVCPVKINNLTFNFHYFYQSDDDIHYLPYFINLVELIFRTYPSHIQTDYDEYHLYIFNYDSERSCLKNGKTEKFFFDKHSGITSQNMTIISKRPEIFRLFIHEVLHLLNIYDAVIYQNEDIVKRKINNFLVEKYNRKSNLNNTNEFFELYADSLALILHLAYFSTSFSDFSSKLMDEIMHSYQQMSKYIYYNNNHNFKLKYFSYVVLRPVVFENLCAFMNQLNVNNEAYDLLADEEKMKLFYQDFLPKKSEIECDELGYNIWDFEINC